MENTSLKENVVLVDADGVDTVACTLANLLTKMTDRNLPQADLADWLVCCALDAQLHGEVQVIFIHSKQKAVLDRFVPSTFHGELDGVAFNEPSVGEFLISAIPDENIMEGNTLMEQSAQLLLDSHEVKHLVLVPGIEGSEKLCALVAKIMGKKKVTMLSMKPMAGDVCHHVSLGYSIMHALGVRPEELR